MHRSCRFRSLWAVLVACWALLPKMTEAQETQCVALELYVESRRPESKTAERAVNTVIEGRHGVNVRVRDLDGPEGDKQRDRLAAVARHFRFDAHNTPVVYGCNRVIVGISDAEELRTRLQTMLRLDVYVRSGCSRCAKAKPFLDSLQARYPGFELRQRDLVRDSRARTELDELVRRHQQAAASVPVFHFCDQLIVGFDHETTTGRRIEKILAHWTYACRLPKVESKHESSSLRRMTPAGFMTGSSEQLLTLSTGVTALSVSYSRDLGISNASPDEVPPLSLPPDDDDTLPLPPDLEIPRRTDSPSTTDAIDVPLFGRLSASSLGLPLFTVAVGLVDGFNPCAMWVLLFLLSILVNLKSRTKILAVAGVFVLISGLAYFAFMAAWLNVFRLVGLLRPVQVALALIAIGVGIIHVKDFFAFKQGVSLSIPEAAKPGIYSRVRQIVTAENLWGAILGASVLAVLVNIVELLCTAGLPALYTEVLALQQLPTWKNYAYLGLYNIAYMFDDGLMVGLVVVTLGRRKMQERQGRILKLISGIAILALGLVMLVKPDWLV